MKGLEDTTCSPPRRALHVLQSVLLGFVLSGDSSLPLRPSLVPKPPTPTISPLHLLLPLPETSVAKTSSLLFSFRTDSIGQGLPLGRAFQKSFRCPGTQFPQEETVLGLGAMPGSCGRPNSTVPRCWADHMSPLAILILHHQTLNFEPEELSPGENLAPRLFWLM